MNDPNIIQAIQDASANLATCVGGCTLILCFVIIFFTGDQA